MNGQGEEGGMLLMPRRVALWRLLRLGLYVSCKTA
jgi:hypothetical protein